MLKKLLHDDLTSCLFLFRSSNLSSSGIIWVLIFWLFWHQNFLWSKGLLPTCSQQWLQNQIESSYWIYKSLAVSIKVYFSLKKIFLFTCSKIHSWWMYGPMDFDKNTRIMYPSPQSRHRNLHCPPPNSLFSIMESTSSCHSQCLATMSVKIYFCNLCLIFTKTVGKVNDYFHQCLWI